MTAHKQRRIHMLLWAILLYSARKVPERARERTSWLYLLEWARLGGKPDKEPT